MRNRLISPHGGGLVDLRVDAERATHLRAASWDWPSWDLDAGQLADLELLASGAYSPLRGFLGRADHDAVASSLRLADGTRWPVPVLLDVEPELARDLDAGARVALRDAEGVLLAVVAVQDVWQAPGGAGRWCVGGPVELVEPPTHYDFHHLRRTPAQLRAAFAARGWELVAAAFVHEPLDRLRLEGLRTAAERAGAGLALLVCSLPSGPGDAGHYTRVRAHEAGLEALPAGAALLSLLPLRVPGAPGGPSRGRQAAVLRAVVARNLGCSHLLVDADEPGRPDPAHTDELGIAVLEAPGMAYLPDRRRYVPVAQVPQGTTARTAAAAEVADRVARGDALPEWLVPAGVAEELARSRPPRARQGFTVFFTGLSGSGKSTVANALLAKLLELGGRRVTLLDGDLVRKHLSSELGFSREHRDLNVRRIGFVAAEITKHGGAAICAPIAPYDATRKDVRAMVSAHGGFVLVHVATPIEVCEARDRKGLYAKARAGAIAEFTGVSDPYEEPDDADVVLDTAVVEPEQAAQQVVDHLTKAGYVDG